MSITPIGFIDVSIFTSMLLLKHKDRASEGILRLRDLGDEGDAVDLPILKEWKSARAVLSKIRSGAAPHFGGKTPELGRAWIEILPPLSGTPWTAEDGEYADQHIRTRTCLVPAPLAVSYSGVSSATLAVGMVNRIEHRALCSEANFSENARIHLIADIRVPDADET